MKKLFAALLAMAMMAVCAGTLAETIIINGSDLQQVTDKSNSYWRWDDSTSTLTITDAASGKEVRVQNWGEKGAPVNGRIVVQNGTELGSLALQNVHIDCQSVNGSNSILCNTVHAENMNSFFGLMIESSTLAGKHYGVYVTGNNNISVQVVDSVISNASNQFSDSYAVYALSRNTNNTVVHVSVDVTGSEISGNEGGGIHAVSQTDTDLSGGEVRVSITGSTVTAQKKNCIFAKSIPFDGTNNKTSPVTVNVIDSQISAANTALEVLSFTKTVSVNIDDGSTVMGNAVIYANPMITMTLGKNVTLDSSSSPVVLPSAETIAALNIAADAYPGLCAYAGGSSETAELLAGSPYSKRMDVKNLVGSAKFIRTGFLPPQIEAPDLPRTGDNSCLALWIGVLAMAATAAMIARRRREA